MKNEKIPSNEVAVPGNNSFVLPLMTSTEIDDFVSFLVHCGYNIHSYETAHDSFRKSMFNSFLSQPEGQTVKSRLYPQKLT